MDDNPKVETPNTSSIESKWLGRENEMNLFRRASAQIFPELQKVATVEIPGIFMEIIE